jgi:putative Mg2+ transporter-C (MgtC) family protein
VPWSTIVLRLIASILCGWVIGWERQVEGKPTGIRTQMLVCLGSCLLMVTGTRMHTPTMPEADLGRLAAGVMTGIGFLGAGAIIRHGSSVIGLTSAASIWVTAAIGIAMGVGSYDIGFFTTALTMVILRSAIPGMKKKERGIRSVEENDENA